MRKLTIAAALMFFAVCLPATAKDYKPDDNVTMELYAEEWVTTKSAKVVLSVEAAVSGNNAGTMRTAMNKAVNDLVKADWRLTSFSRSLDQTGMERWSAMYEARVQESDLNNLADSAKKISKAGMQLTVAGIDFSPSQEEIQAAQSSLRGKIYKSAVEQLALLNSAVSGRDYRIASIDFTGDSPRARTPLQRAMRGYKSANMELAMASMETSDMPEQQMEIAQKATISAIVEFAALPPESKSETKK